MVRISEKDMIILEILMRNARTPFAEIARRIGVTEAAVRKRVRKLEELGIIKGYRAVVDPKKIGYSVVALVGFDIEPEHYVDVLEKVRSMNEVRRMLSTAGDHMVIVECWFRDASEMAGFVRQLESMEGVTRVCPAILVEELK